MNRELDKIIRLMGRLYGRDISIYDVGFLTRSLDRRASATGCRTLAAYLVPLSDFEAEAETFYRSLRVSYSEFFRNPLTFALLEQLILPGLIAEKERAGRSEIRVWSAGCAAGQEPYSLAILLDELTAGRRNTVSFRIFATDSSEPELAAAREGVYDPAAVGNVRLKHLSGYFSGDGGSYVVANALKERVSFSVHDMLDEGSLCPPASIYGEFDLAICSNLLFYYRPDIRRSILNKLEHCLAPDGYLVTGEAERELVAKLEGFRAVFPGATVYRRR
ncbi:MAG: protein-glutamate O-methyltransferase CheR [Anaerolineae bacterium]|nr:protein-glutamate O-methyltransferase CheR [Anaerolineae bacterium]